MIIRLYYKTIRAYYKSLFGMYTSNLGCSRGIAAVYIYFGGRIHGIWGMYTFNLGCIHPIWDVLAELQMYTVNVHWDKGVEAEPVRMFI
jgi:hypothetical protein